ncbi:hypothetical protein Pmar_PMAR013083, partial [Perkinsus marinus ATCC 50983]
LRQCELRDTLWKFSFALVLFEKTPELVEAWQRCAASWTARELFDHHFVRGILLELEGQPKADDDDERAVFTEKDLEQVDEWQGYDDAQLDK